MFVILVGLHSQKWINILLFELVATFIETHIFVTSFLISHIFIFVIKFFLLFLTTIREAFNLNILHPTICIHHNISMRKYSGFRVSYLATHGSNV